MSALAAAVRYRSLVDRLGAIIWEAIPGRRPGEATFTFVSEHTESLLGYPAQRWTSDTRFWFEMIHPDDRDRVNAEIVGSIRSGHADFEYRAATADGREVWLRNIVQTDTTQPELRLTGVLVDITARKAADARLLRLQDVTDALSGLLSAHEAAQVIATQARAAIGAVAAAVFLREGSELILRGYDGHPGLTADPECRFGLDHQVPAAETARTGTLLRLDAQALVDRYPTLASWRLLAGDGPFVALPLKGEERVLGSIAVRLREGQETGPEDLVVLDVLERAGVSALLRAEQTAAERTSWAVLETIITTAPEAFALFDTSLRYVRVNDALAEMHGLPIAEHVGRSLGEVVPDSGHAGPLRQVLETGEPIVDVEVSGVTAPGSGDVRTWLVSYYPVHNAEDKIQWVGKFMTDITARKRAEQQSRLVGELGSAFDAVVTVEARMSALVDALVPAVCTTAAVALRAPDGALERVASRGTDRPNLTVPLLVRGRDLGVLDLTLPQAGDEDRAFAAEVARRAALAIDNARLFEGERLARERTGRQYAVAAALAEALSAADVAAVTLNEVIGAVGAEHGTMWQVNDEGTAIDAIGWDGFDDAEMAGWEQASLSDSRPVADAVRTKRMVYLATPEEMDQAYPAMAAGLRQRELRSMVVFPLSTAGRVVGGLLLSATRPHAFTDDDLALGTALAAQAATAVERARLFEAERHVSVTLQRALLPAALPEVAGVELDLRYLPAAGLAAGGDFYEALALDDGSLVVAVGDVVGRGANAAAAMGQLRSALRAFALTGEEPAPLLARLSAFADTVAEAMAATAVVAKLDPGTGRLRYACAGHPWPVLVSSDGKAELLMGGRGVPLGCLPDPQYVEDSIALEPGATLLLYTDGLTERRGEDMDAALERLRASLAAHAGEPLPALLDRAVRDAGPVAPADDVALVALRFTGAASPSAQQLVFPAALDQVPVARHALRDWLAEIGIGGLPASDILLAAGEAIANAVEHSGTDTFELELDAPAGGVIRIVVRDRGGWKEPVVSPHRGRGFGLMRTLMDECIVARRAD
ncbi:MAG: hypothetical protein QOI80_1549, partial [Solirubrobacteraceae bacterium]|nr:hypothetical protein [Solirubrobacteraceae bacterium]